MLSGISVEENLFSGRYITRLMAIDKKINEDRLHRLYKQLKEQRMSEIQKGRGG